MCFCEIAHGCGKLGSSACALDLCDVAMSVAHVRVTSSVAGTELLPWTAFQLVDLTKQLLAALGSRPSRTVSLFQNGIMVSDVQAAPDEWIDLTAVISDVLSVEQREAFIQQLKDAVIVGETDEGDVFDVFMEFPEAARDDRTLVLAAVQLCGCCLEEVSGELCQNDREIVLAAVKQDGGCLTAASEACRNDKEILLAAVQNTGSVLACASDALKNDKDVVLAAVKKSPRSFVLACASDALKNDKDVVLAAVKHSPRCLRLASESLRHDNEILQAAAARPRGRR